MSEELKPCPFCGGQSYIEIIPPHTHSEWLKKELPDLPDCEGFAYAWCRECSASVPANNKEEAIKAWNRRADNADK